MRFDTHNLVLEGPDLSGKTTIYNLLHEKTEFSRNIQDRSCLSMLCYAILYDRDVEKWRNNLYRELTCLNNRVVILLPSFQILTQRYHARGDEIQDLDSLEVLYNIFSAESEKISDLPTVKLIADTSSPHDMCNSVIEWLDSLEKASPKKVGKMMQAFVTNAPKDEYVLDIEYQSTYTEDDDVLCDPKEGDYYISILTHFQDKIQDELNGVNEYNLPQTFESRRFYYNSDSCISSLHLLPRDYKVDLIATLRSTDIERNASIDFEFLNFLLSYFTKMYFKTYEVGSVRARFNSAHIRRDLY